MKRNSADLSASRKIQYSQAEQITMERRMPYDDFTHRVMEDIRHLSCQLLS